MVQSNYLQYGKNVANVTNGQSAAKGPRNWFKVQRLDKVIYAKRYDEISTNGFLI